MNHRKVSMSLVILLSVTVLSGCVTQETYTGTDTPVSERKVNKVTAASKRVQLGLTYLQKGNSEQAKANLDRALALAPDLEEVHIAFAYYYSSVGELEKTENAYRRATNLRGLAEMHLIILVHSCVNKVNMLSLKKCFLKQLNVLCILSLHLLTKIWEFVAEKQV